MNKPLNHQAAQIPQWPSEDNRRIPAWVYHDSAIYRRELDRIFYGPFWSFVGLACEVPNPGDYKRAVVGERPVLLVRDEDGNVNVVMNTCAHRGSEVCQKTFGSAKELMCPYHQWVYNLKGDLIGVPFRRGIKGKGGFPKDFDLSKHGLRKLKVENVNGAIFASFDESVLPMEQYLGELYPRLTRVFDGRELEVLGYQRQRIKGNWKLYPENMRDSYHATLMHVFLISFGLYRHDQKGLMGQDSRTMTHNLVASIAHSTEDKKVAGDMRSLKSDFVLNDMRIMQSHKEYDDDITIQIVSVFPAITFQQQQNLLQCRNVIPLGPDEFELSWTFFGYADDTEEIRKQRLRLANLVGAAGFISVDDNEAFEFTHAGIHDSPGHEMVVELGAEEYVPGEGEMVTEGPIRAFYKFYRSIMDLG